MIFRSRKTRYGSLVTATSGGTLILAANALQFQVFTGALNHSMRLPDATLTSNGKGIQFTVINESTGTITVQYNDGSTLDTVAAGTSKDFTLTSVSTSNGTWRIAALAGGTGGGIGYSAPGSVITSNYSVLPTDNGRVLNVDTTSGAVSITLPAPSANFLITVKDYVGNSHINTITVARNGSESIDTNADDKVIDSRYSSLSLISNGTDWFIVGGAELQIVSGDTALFAGSGALSDDIEYVNITTGSDTEFFGDLTLARSFVHGLGSKVRGVFGGGFNGVNVNTIDFVQFDTLANAVDFGDLTVARNGHTACSNSTRGVFAGGAEGGNRNEIDYITIATTGNAIDFGDLTLARAGLAGCSSNTRGVFAGGSNGGSVNNIDYITIATTGNAIDFGDLTVANRNYGASCSSRTRGLFAGGSPAATPVISIEYVTIATLSNAVEFADLTVARDQLASASSSIKGIFAGGNNGTLPATYSTIDYVTIATLADAEDFGDLTTAKVALAGCSNAHGGL